jgi:hypothetical protein
MVALKGRLEASLLLGGLAPGPTTREARLPPTAHQSSVSWS